MKQYFHITFFFLITLLSSCGNEMDLISQESHDMMEQATLTVNLEGAVNTKAEMPTLSGYDKRYILEIWKQETGNTFSRYKRIVQTTANSSANTFNLQVPKGWICKVAVWVDYVTEGSVADLHYQTDSIRVDDSFPFGLSQVIIKEPGKWADALTVEYSPSEDAFTAFLTWEEVMKDQSVTATRPFAQLNILASDAPEWEDVFLFYDNSPFRIDAMIYGISNRYDALTGEVGITDQDFSRKYTTTKNNFNYAYNACYFSCLSFSAKEISTHGVWVRKQPLSALDAHNTGAAPMTLTWNLIQLNNIPLKRNYATNLIGNLILQDVNFQISVDGNMLNRTEFN